MKYTHLLRQRLSPDPAEWMSGCIQRYPHRAVLHAGGTKLSRGKIPGLGLTSPDFISQPAMGIKEKLKECAHDTL